MLEQLRPQRGPISEAAAGGSVEFYLHEESPYQKAHKLGLGCFHY